MQHHSFGICVGEICCRGWLGERGLWGPGIHYPLRILLNQTATCVEPICCLSRLTCSLIGCLSKGSVLITTFHSQCQKCICCWMHKLLNFHTHTHMWCTSPLNAAWLSPGLSSEALHLWIDPSSKMADDSQIEAPSRSPWWMSSHGLISGLTRWQDVSASPATCRLAAS